MESEARMILIQDSKSEAARARHSWRAEPQPETPWAWAALAVVIGVTLIRLAQWWMWP